jgi:pimeloyl-ACP methyl ester carboxylesterase
MSYITRCPTRRYSRSGHAAGQPIRVSLWHRRAPLRTGPGGQARQLSAQSVGGRLCRSGMRATLTDSDLEALEVARLEASDPLPRLPPVTRIEFVRPGTPTVSALHWRQDSPLLVFLHGGFENAHVWDLVGIELDRPFLAVDLPGCGCSGRIERGTYWPPNTNGLLSHVLRQVAPDPVTLVGLSYGGLVALSLLAAIPDCISQVILLDVLPGSAPEHAERVVQWLRECPRAWSLAQLEARWAELHPSRSDRFRRQQILSSHMGQFDALVPNADCRPERWTPIPGFDHLWQILRNSRVPIGLIRAGRSRVVPDVQIEHLLGLRPDAFVETLTDAGHHIPMHAPRALASILQQRVPKAPA